MPRIKEDTRDRARTMRHVPTDAERKLWSILRRRQIGGWYFRRQHPIPPYIADFACVEARLVVEADGGQHADPPTTPPGTSICGITAGGSCASGTTTC